ncbi:MAG: hypothetical protein ABFR95_05790 [Actinomycetota bacterium]
MLFVIRPWFLLLGLFSVALVGCTGEPTESSDPADPSAVTVPVAGAGDELGAFPIGFLEGDPLPRPSNLVLLAGDTIVDVDADADRRLDGLPEGGDLIVWSVAVGEGAVVLVDCHQECGAPELFAIDDQSDVARSIAFGFAAPAPGGVWVTRGTSETICTLTKVGLDGTILIPERPFDCDLSVVEETSVGLVVSIPQFGPEQGAILDPETLDPIIETGRIHAVVDGRVLSWGGASFDLLDLETGAVAEIARPTDVGAPSYGRVSPDGRFVAISFEHPAWPGPRQRLDVWVLEVETLGWIRLPSMPVAAALKGTNEAWAPDGRFVMFGFFEKAERAVVTWRPGDRELSIRQLDTNPAGSLIVWTGDSP